MIIELKKYLPAALYNSVRKIYRKYNEILMKTANLKKITYGGVIINVPKNHIVLTSEATQPYREIGLVISVRFLGAKYPNKVIIDIGANIGDTGVLIASQCANELILVEPSEYFYKILSRNISKIRNKYSLHKCLVGDGDGVAGSLIHVGSTAFFQPSIDSAKIETKKIESLTNSAPCFVKIDTDGFDFTIIKSNFKYFEKYQPALYFENTIRSNQDLVEAEELFGQLVKSGYTFFSIWDDAGFHIACTSDVEVIYSLNRYLCKLWTTKDACKSISNFDVLALHKIDADVYRDINRHFISY